MALSDIRNPKQRTPEMVDANLVTGVTVYKGAIIVQDTATGYCKPAVTGTGLVCLGIAAMEQASVTTTSSGATTIPVKRGIWLCKNSAAADEITNAWRGQPCFLVDDQTVAKTDGSASRSVAGTVVEVTTEGVYVEFGSVNGTALAAEITAREALDTDLKSSTGTTLAGVLTAKQAALVANGNVVGGIPVLHRIDVADGTTGDVDTVLTYKTLITDIWLVKTGGAGGASDTITVKNGSTAITDAIDINVSDKVMKRAGTMDDAQTTVLAGGTLKITRTKASAANVACTVFALGVRVS
jgi:hypothetical protein